MTVFAVVKAHLGPAGASHPAPGAGPKRTCLSGGPADGSHAVTQHKAPIMANPPPAAPKKALPPQLPLGPRFAFIAISAMIAESVRPPLGRRAVYPVDLVKTRLQLQGEMQSGAGGPARHGAFGTAVTILRREGLRGLYAGLSPAVARHVPYTGTRILVYEQLREAAARAGLAASGGELPLGLKLAIGAASGALGQLIAVPADLVKVRMQADGRLVATGQLQAPRYRGLVDAFSKIAREEGLAGLWRGTGPAVQRAALVNLGELATYDSAKRAVLSSGWFEDNAWAHLASAVCSGFVATVASSPADVVKTRMMAQQVGSGAAGGVRYASSLDCLVRTVRTEGVGALYKGFFPTWSRLGPWQLVFWLSYEQLRRVTGMGTF